MKACTHNVPGGAVTCFWRTQTITGATCSSAPGRDVSSAISLTLSPEFAATLSDGVAGANDDCYLSPAEIANGKLHSSLGYQGGQYRAATWLGCSSAQLPVAAS